MPPAASRPDRAAVRRLVRETLGCGCPEAVFDAIEHGPGPGGCGARMLVGNRLLVYLWPVAPGEDVTARALALLHAGREERDRLGLNRFRAVLVGAVEADYERAALAFARAARGDARAHLHGITAEAARALLPVAAAPERDSPKRGIGGFSPLG